MPDPNEIAAAEDRMRRFRAGEPAHLIWSTLESDWKIADERMRQDTDTLDAYLAEHADEPDRNEYPDSHRLSYGALAAILGRKHDRYTDTPSRELLWVNGVSSVAALIEDGTHVVLVSAPGIDKHITTCGELRAFCVLAGWTNQERGASRGE